MTETSKRQTAADAAEWETADKGRIRAALEYGDLSEAHRILEESGVKNPKTGRPYGYQTLQRHLLGLLPNPPLWEALGQITRRRSEAVDRVRQHFQNRPERPAAMAG